MKDNRNSYNIAERLAGKRTRRVQRSSAPTEAAVPTASSPPRIVMTVEEMG